MKSNSKILIIEDDVALNDAYKTILTTAGYTVSTAFNGEEALEVGVDLLEGLQQPLAAFLVEAGDAAAQAVDGAGEVVAVGHQGGEARFLLGRFFFGA